MSSRMIQKSSSCFPSMSIVSGRGAFVYDTCGRRYVDFDNAKGSVTLGHGVEPVATAVAAAARGHCGAPTAGGPLCERVSSRLADVCQCETVAFFRSGTAAVKAAAEVLQKASGRKIILSAGYHGYDPYWERAAVPFEPNSHGVIDFYYDLYWMRRLLDKHKADLAGFVISPDYLHLPDQWYSEVHQIIAESGALMVLDDVKLGFRYSPGLSVHRFGWQVPVAVVSKGLANGHPLSAVVGQSALLGPLADYVYTSLYDPITFAAADATLELMSDPATQATIRSNGDTFIACCRGLLRKEGIPIEIVGNGNLFQFVCASDDLENTFQALCRENGLLFYHGDNQCPSLSLSGSSLAASCEAAERAITQLRDADVSWGETAVEVRARYDAAWRVMDGLGQFGDDEATASQQLTRLLSSD